MSVYFSELKYKLIERTINTLISSGSEVFIFGGYCRDKILHDYAASKYYKLYDTDKQAYNDPNYHPELIDRVLTANDIDAFVRGNEEVVNKLIDKLRAKGFKVRLLSKKARYFDGIELSQRKFIITVPLLNFINDHIEFTLDVLFSDTILSEPPFDRCDFECNTFIYDKTGLRLSKYYDCREYHCTELVQQKIIEARIINDIIQKKTNIFPYIVKDDPMTDHHIRARKFLFSRLLNLQKRGWIVENVDFLYLKEKEHIDVKCAICLADINQEDYIKLKCCNIYLHIDCFKTYINGELSERITPRCINHCANREKGLTIL